MTPAQQRLEAGQLVGLEVDDGLIRDLELMSRQRRTQVELERSARLQPHIHLRLEIAVAVAAVGLGTVQRNIGVLEKTVGVLAVARNGYSNARADDDVVAADIVRLVDGFDHAPRERSRLLPVLAQD